MGFATGSVSFRRFAVVGKSPERVDEALLQKLSDNALRPTEMGVPEEIEYGWSGGRHVLDDQFSFDSNVFADTLFFGLKIDTNKVPGDLKKAYTLMEEATVAKNNPSGFISKAQKKEVKSTINEKVEDDMRSGRFRRSKVIPIMWDLPRQTIYSAVSGKKFEMLAEIFERTFGLSLLPLSAGSLALQLLEPRGHRRDYEDLKPTRFVSGPEGEGQYPDYPWVAKGPEPKDFAGNEFMMWLWYEAEHHDGDVRTIDGKVVSLFFDRSLDLDCAYGQTGRDGLRGQGPGKSPEARDAVRIGKVPRKAGLLMHVDKNDFSLSLNAESLGVGAGKLPDVEDAESPRVLFEERIALLRDLTKTIDGLFDAFLKLRTSPAWEGQVGKMRRWMMHPTAAVAAA